MRAAFAGVACGRRVAVALRLALAAFAFALVTACGDNQDPAAAANLWDAIHAETYRAFDHAPGYSVARASSAPHGDRVVIYVNGVVTAALALKEALEVWPEGSLIVKDGFDDDNQLELVAVMQKREDGWFWAEYEADGRPTYSGKPGLCIDCHRSGADGVRAFGFRNLER